MTPEQRIEWLSAGSPIAADMIRRALAQGKVVMLSQPAGCSIPYLRFFDPDTSAAVAFTWGGILNKSLDSKLNEILDISRRNPEDFS